MKNTLPSNKKHRVLLAVLVFLTFAMVSPCSAKYSGGTGEPNNPYQISSADDLLTMAVNIDDYNSCFILTADINLGPSGTFTTAVIAPQGGGIFNGVFDGAGHKITNLTINGGSNSYIGLFGYIGSNCQIKNLCLENRSVKGSSCIGGLAGQNYGYISNCCSKGTVTNGSVIGGLAGDNYGTISNCYSTGTNASGYWAGGLVGRNYGTISDCNSTNAVTNGEVVGGLVASNYGDISNCYSTGTASSNDSGGGLVGRHNSGSISNCYSASAISCPDHAKYLGGLVGQNNGGSISNCCSTGTVTAEWFVEYIGGLVGNNSTGSISNSYSTGAVNAGDQCNYFGGLVGVNSGSISSCHAMGMVYSVDEYSNDFGGLVGANNGSIEKCYSMGDVNCGYGSQCLGGLVGYNWSGGNIKNCYSTGNIYSVYTSTTLGGLVGENGGNISDCYSTGAVSGDGYIGGLVGRNDSNISNCYTRGTVTGTFVPGGLVGWNNNGTFSNCYYLITSGPDNECGCGTPLTDAQMKMRASFVGWDFVGETANGVNDFWWLCNDGLEYPRLYWQYLPGDTACPGVVGIEDLVSLCDQWLFNEIPADLAPLGGDGTVDFADFAIFANQWGVTKNISDLLDFAEQWLKAGILRCSADISPWPDGDRVVDFFDFAVMAGNWQTCFVAKAISPNPADDLVIINRNVILQWSPGQSCASHDIYFGIDFNNISSADTSSAQFVGSQISNTWNTNNYAPAGLDLNTIYYWRIDEVAVDCMTKGDVWGFKVAPLGKAMDPQPSDALRNVTKHPVLRWSAATYASSHDVYFGTNYNDVNVAVCSSSEYMGNQDVNHWDTNNFNSNGLEYLATYYWRIDELKDVNITKGNIWSFTTCSEPNTSYGLAAWWKFDEANGIIAYDSAGHSDGNLVGGPAWTSGKIGGGLNFDGVDDYVNCGSGPSNYDNITVSVWMKTSTSGALVSNRYGSLLSSGTWYMLYSRSIVIGDNSQGGYRNVTFSVNTINNVWHHIVYTKDGVNHAIYVDGSLDRQFISNADISRNVPLIIGMNYYPYSLFKGIIDEVRIYNRALSEEEVAILYAEQN